MKSRVFRAIWYLVSILIFNREWNISSVLKIVCLRLFGAKIGKGTIIKPKVKIKYPWKLVIGDFCWIGESVIIDNLEWIILEDRVCISQNSYLVNGNHKFNEPGFTYYGKEIKLESQVWIGAASIIGPGVICGKGSVLQLGSVLTSNMKEHGIYGGNPAKFRKWRKSLYP